MLLFVFINPRNITIPGTYIKVTNFNIYIYRERENVYRERYWEYIYIYRERESERDRQTERDIDTGIWRFSSDHIFEKKGISDIN